MSETEKLKEIKIAVVGGTSDGKTTFLISILNSMCKRVVRLSDSHTVRIEAVGLKKGLIQSDEVGKNSVETDTEDRSEELAQLSQKLADASQGDIASMMVNARAAAAKKSPVRSIDKDGDISVLDMEEGSTEAIAAMLDITDQIAKLFSFPTSGGNATFATVTTRYVVITFNVLVDEQVKCRLIITDYAGEVVDLAADRIVSERLKLSYSRQIADSDGAIILCNATKLSDNLAKDRKDNSSMFKIAPLKLSLNIDKISPILTVSKANSPYSILIAISQADHPQLDPSVKRHRFKETERHLQEYIYDTIASWAISKKKAFGILPISAFGKNAEGQPNVNEYNQLIKNCDPNPEGIDKAVLFSLYNVSLDRDKQIAKMIEEKKRSSFFWWFGSTKKTINELESIRENYSDMRIALMNTDGFFDDIYEMTHEENNDVDPDPRFPNEITADIKSIRR